MPLEFYIGLYDIKEPGFYHWALFAVPEGGHISGRVHVFQIIGQKPGYQGEDGYMANHGEWSLNKSGNFVGAIRLPSVNITIQELIGYMRARPVGRRGVPLIDTPNPNWSCFQWAIRALQGLIFANALVTDQWSSFNQQSASHHAWGTTVYFAARHAANNALKGRGVDRSSGVPQMSFDKNSLSV